MSLLALIAGQLWRDPVARESKSGKQFSTASIRAGTPTEPVWVKIIVFSETAQAELMRLKDGDALSAQGTLKISVYEKAGEHRVSIEIVAAQILALRQPRKAKRTALAKEETSAPPPWDDGYGGGYR
jgi:single-stranded DNA-binding protein